MGRRFAIFPTHMHFVLKMRYKRRINATVEDLVIIYMYSHHQNVAKMILSSALRQVQPA